MNFWKKLLGVNESPKAGLAEREPPKPSATSEIHNSARYGDLDKVNRANPEASALVEHQPLDVERLLLDSRFGKREERAAALYSLSGIDDVRVFHALTEGLGAGSSIVNGAARRALPEFLNRFGRNAILALASAKREAALDALFEVLIPKPEAGQSLDWPLGETAGDELEAVLIALGDLALSRVQGLLDQAKGSRRVGLSRVLLKIAAVGTSSPEQRAELAAAARDWAAVASIGAAAFGPLLSALRSERHWREGERACALSALRAILPCISSDSILAAIDHADWSVNEAAVELLGSRRDPDTLELLARAVVSCRSQWARVRACHAIADLARPAEAETVILSLVGEADPIVKEACLDALGQVGGVEAAIVVAGHLRSENRNLRAAAARAIGRMEIRRVPMREQDLLALLADLDIQTRAALAEVLAEASPAKVAPLAEKVLSELLVQPWTNYASGVSTDIVRLHPRPNLPRLMRLAHLPADVIALSDMAISYEEVRSSPGWVAGVNTEKGDDAVIRLCNIPGPVVTSVLERVATLEDGSVEADSNRNSLQEWPLCFEKRRRLAHAELLRRRGGTV